VNGDGCNQSCLAETGYICSSNRCTLGDANNDGSRTTADNQHILSYIIGSRPVPVVGSRDFIAADANCDRQIDVRDIASLSDALLNNGVLRC